MTEPKAVVGIVREALTLLPKQRRSRWLLLVVAATMSGVIESVGAVLVLIVMSLLTGSEATQLPFQLPGALDPSGGSNRVFVVAAGVFFLLRGMFLLGQSYFQNRVVHQTGVAISSELLDGYLKMPYELQRQRDSTELIRNAFTSVSDVVGAVLSPAALILSESFLAVGIIVILVLAEPFASLITLIVVVPVLWLILRGVQPRLAKLGAVSHSSHHMTLRWLQKGVQGLREIKLFHREEHVRRHFDESRAELSKALYLRATLVEIPRLSVETILLLFILALVVIEGSSGQPSEAFVSFLGLVAYAVLRITPSLNRIVANLNSIQFGGPAVSAVFKDLQAIRAASSDFTTESSTGDEETIGFSNLDLAAVTFRYPHSDAVAVQDVSYRIEKGDLIGIVGPSGSGKSTLVDLMLGLIEPSSGRISVNGSKLPAVRRKWQRSVGIVPQNIFLLDDTLLENITFGAAGTAPDASRLHEALEIAQLSRLVEKLPQGVHTDIGERGASLSGGERQRIAIARAIYREPEVLIFDEGLSALDAITERAVISKIRRRFVNSTIISIAHRISSLRDCNSILVMDAGRLVAVDTHDSLLESSALFRDLASQSHDDARMDSVETPSG